MNKKNQYKTYFAIVGDYPVKEVIDILSPFKPDNYWDKEDLRRDNKKYGFSRIEYFTAKGDNNLVYEMMEESVKPLKDKIDILKKIKEKYDVKYYLSVVVEIYKGEISPCLAPSLDVIDFCHASRCEIDIDTYVY